MTKRLTDATLRRIDLFGPADMQGSKQGKPRSAVSAGVGHHTGEVVEEVTQDEREWLEEFLRKHAATGHNNGPKRRR